MRTGHLLAAGAAVIGAGSLAAVVAQGPAQPRARYMIDVATASNSMPMAGMMPGGGQSREVTLRLGSVQAPVGGAAKADHFMPAGMRLGASVPLLTPTPGAPSSPAPTSTAAREQPKLPKARLVIYWGCGAHAGPGQPVVIDFTKIAAGKTPPNLYTANVPVEQGPLPGNSRTYGDWPNQTTREPVDRRASLLGEHRVAANYAPEIRFTLTQDFLAPLKVKSATAGDGSTAMSWNAVPGATGYYAWVMGGAGMAPGGAQDMVDMVWWTSAGTRDFGGGLQDWLTPATVARLVGQRIVMPAGQTACTVPAEVKQAAGGGMMVGFMTAYGPEESFAYPPRPADPRAAWRPEWTAKARYKSSTMMLLGMPGMGSMLSGDAGAAAEGQAQPAPKKCKPKLGGMLGALAGLKTC